MDVRFCVRTFENDEKLLVEVGFKMVSTDKKINIIEEKHAKLRASNLYTSGLIDNYSSGSFEDLLFTHRYMFQDVYPFAGELRTVNMAKGSFRFADVRYLEESIAFVESMPCDDFNSIIEKYVEMNIVHPFREGNGRAMRIWLNAVLKSKIGKIIDWSVISKEKYFDAMIKSPVDDANLKDLLYNSVTENINDYSMIFKGIDQSFYFEDCDNYEFNGGT